MQNIYGRRIPSRRTIERENMVYIKKKLVFLFLLIAISSYGQECLLPINSNFDLLGYDLILQRLFNIPTRGDWCIIASPTNDKEYCIYYDNNHHEICLSESSICISAEMINKLVDITGDINSNSEDSIVNIYLYKLLDVEKLSKNESSVTFKRTSLKINDDLALSLRNLFLTATHTVSFQPLNKGFIPNNYSFPYTKFKVYCGWAISGYYGGELYIPTDGPHDDSNCSMLFKLIDTIYHSIRQNDIELLEIIRRDIDNLTESFMSLTPDYQWNRIIYGDLRQH